MTRAEDFELQPTLKGPRLLLCPLRAEDFDALYAVASDPLVWEVHPEPDRWQRPVFETFFRGALESGGAFAVEDAGRVVGSSRFYGLKPAERSIVIGYSFLARSHWGGSYNREMKFLMLDHAFRFVDVVEFHVGEDNLRSRRAMEKIGGVLSDRFETKDRNGVPRWNVVYKIMNGVARGSI